MLETESPTELAFWLPDAPSSSEGEASESVSESDAEVYATGQGWVQPADDASRLASLIRNLNFTTLGTYEALEERGLPARELRRMRLLLAALRSSVQVAQHEIDAGSGAVGIALGFAEADWQHVIAHTNACLKAVQSRKRPRPE